MEKLPWEAAPETGGHAGVGKVTTLGAAVKDLVQPGYSLQIGSGLGYPMALLYEIIRRFWGSRPGFTLITNSGSATNLVPFLQGGLVDKVLTSFMGDPYPFPSPNALIQKAFAAGDVVFEEWSLLTLTQRLAAGAMGLPFFPTHSLAGSSLSGSLPGYREVEDPFSGRQTGVVRALNPDLSLVHGWMADTEGNTVLNLPLVGNVYGPLAAKHGVVVSAERVVSPDELARCREHVRIPAEVVRAVVEIPFGAHPSGHHNFPRSGDDWGYAEDREFIITARKACKSEAQYREWLDHWILGCPDHKRYLEKLGAERLFKLKGRLASTGWPLEFLEPRPDPGPATPAEQMIIAAAGEIEKIVTAKEYHSILAGVGASHLASWLACFSLREQGRETALLAEIGLYGYTPLPGDPFVFALRNFPACSLYSDILQTLGCHVSGNPGRRCLGVLGAGQVDCRGNINSSQIPAASLYLVGSGGGNDVASGAAEVVVVVEQSPLRFVEQVPFVTSPGDKVSAVVSQLGVFRKDPDSKTLKLAACRRRPGASKEEAVREISEQCGWELEITPRLETIPEPPADELQKLRFLDPDRYFTR